MAKSKKARNSAISRCIRELMHKGYPQAQAIAIAYSKQRGKKKR